MEWIADLVKHLGISKLFAVAVFTTSAVLLFGPNYWPAQIPEIKDVWRILAVATLVFSGTYLILWSLQWLWGVANRAKNALAHRLYSGQLTAADEQLIQLIATQPSETLNILLLNFDGQQISKIELMQHAKFLARSGLVEISRYDDSIVSLTERGKQHAARTLANHRASRKNA